MTRLQAILEDQLTEAKRKAGIKTVRKLPNGLRIELTCISQDVQLTLTRDTVYPSEQEWQTVSKYFPYPIPKDVDIKTRQEGSRYIMTARIPSQRAMQMKFA